MRTPAGIISYVENMIIYAEVKRTNRTEQEEEAFGEESVKCELKEA